MKISKALVIILFQLVAWHICASATNESVVAETDTLQLYQKLQQGESLIKTHPDSALSIAEEVIAENKGFLNNPLKRSKGSKHLLAKSHLVKGNAARYLGQYDAALSYLKNAEEIYRQISNRKGQADANHAIGNIYFLFGEFNIAKQHYKKSISQRGKEEITDKIKSYSNLGSLYFRQGNYDSAIFYNTRCFEHRSETGDSLGMANSLSNLGNIELFKGHIQKALNYYNSAYKLLDTINTTRNVASVLNNIGLAHDKAGDYQHSITSYLKALNIYSKLGDKHGQSKIYSNVGNLHILLKNYEDAQQNLNEGLAICFELGDKGGVSDAYLSLGRVHTEQKKLDSALIYYYKSLEIKDSIGDLFGRGNCLQNIGLVLSKKNQTTEALENYLKAEKIYKNGENLHELSVLYNNIADLYLKTKHFSKANEYALKALELSQTLGSMLQKMDALNALSKIAIALNKYHKAVNYLEQYNLVKDSIYTQDKEQAILEISMKYDAEKNKRIMERQSLLLTQRDLEIENSNRENHLQKLIRNIVILFSLAISIIAFFILRTLLNTRKLNNILEEQRHDILDKNEELSKLNEELEAQRDQIEQANEILLTQKDQLQKANLKVEKSLEYAEYIQTAVLPDQERIDSILKESFVLYMPLERVGGDFYWIDTIGKWTYIVVGDCTGHGIPGGFMNMLGVSALRLVVNMSNTQDPSLVQQLLREELIKTLHQTDDHSNFHDGIDMAVICYNQEEGILHFSGSRSCLLWAKSEETEILKGDPISVAQAPQLLPFTTKTIHPSKGDAIYLYTDGYVDQFNPYNEKIGRRRMVELCNKYHKQTMRFQKELFYRTFTHWKDIQEQTDDALVLGFRI